MKLRTFEKEVYYIFIILWVTSIMLIIIEGCSSKKINGDFKTGPVVITPPGCIEGRKRGVDC